MSSHKSASSEIVSSSGLECETLGEDNDGRSTTAANELDIVIPVNAGAFVEQDDKGCLDEVDVLCQASCPKPLASNDSEPREQQTRGGHTSATAPMCLEPGPGHVLAVAISAPRNDSIFADALPAARSHIRCDDDRVQPPSYPTGPEPGGQNVTSAPQTSWTKDLDERLLHLRQVAQLDWCRVIKYFPEETLSDVKRRYRKITRTGPTCDTLRMQHGSTAHEPEAAARSSSEKTAPEREYRAVSRGAVNAAKAKCKNTVQVRRHVTKPRNPYGDVTGPTVASYDGAVARTSRCGRTIRHPFRDRPAEGYI